MSLDSLSSRSRRRMCTVSKVVDLDEAGALPVTKVVDIDEGGALSVKYDILTYRRRRSLVNKVK